MSQTYTRTSLLHDPITAPAPETRPTPAAAPVAQPAATEPDPDFAAPEGAGIDRSLPGGPRYFVVNQASAEWTSNIDPSEKKSLPYGTLVWVKYVPENGEICAFYETGNQSPTANRLTPGTMTASDLVPVLDLAPQGNGIMTSQKSFANPAYVIATTVLASPMNSRAPWYKVPKGTEVHRMAPPQHSDHVLVAAKHADGRLGAQGYIHEDLLRPEPVAPEKEAKAEPAVFAKPISPERFPSWVKKAWVSAALATTMFISGVILLPSTETKAGLARNKELNTRSFVDPTTAAYIAVPKVVAKDTPSAKSKSIKTFKCGDIVHMTNDGRGDPIEIRIDEMTTAYVPDRAVSLEKPAPGSCTPH